MLDQMSGILQRAERLRSAMVDSSREACATAHTAARTAASAPSLPSASAAAASLGPEEMERLLACLSSSSHAAAVPKPPLHLAPSTAPQTLLTAGMVDDAAAAGAAAGESPAAADCEVV